MPARERPSKPPGLRAQIGSTRDAAQRLVISHIDLARAEAAVIGGEIAKAAGLIGAAIGLVLVAILLVIIGSALWLSDWLLGSMGWGVLHGLLLFVAIAITSVLVVLDVPSRKLGQALLLGGLTGVLVAFVASLSLFNLLYRYIGDVAGLAVDPATRPLVVGTLIWGAVGLLVGIGLAIRMSGGAGGRIGALLGLTLAGAAFGAFTSIRFGVQVGIALGFTVAYAAWIGVMLLHVSRTGIDTEAIKERFYPRMTIDTAKETLEWLQTRIPGRNDS